MSKDQIIAMLPDLEPDELRAVAAVVASLLGDRTGGIDQPATMTAAVIFEALSEALKVNLPYAKTMGTKWGKLFDQKVPGLVDWLNANFAGWDLNKVTAIAFLSMVFDLVVKDLRDKDAPVSFGSVVQNFDRIPQVFDHAFPDYIKSGVGHLILQPFMPPQMGPRKRRR